MSSSDIFDKYSDWYDVLYLDKDYEGESRYVLDRLDREGPYGSLLELGCGTGRHALEFAGSGRNVVAIDRSPGMLARAERFLKESEPKLRDRIRLVQSDVQHLELGQHFSAAVSLFHVLSYQIEQSDLEAFFQSVARHLHPGGIFLCDFWYGPAVLYLRPETRSKKVSAAEIEVHRVSVPELDTAANVVHVQFDTYVRRAGSPSVEYIAERHSMRYFFESELRELTHRMGFKTIRFEEWVTGHRPGPHTWGVAAIFKRD